MHISQLWTRLLYPFFIERERGNDAADALLATAAAFGGASEPRLWQDGQPHALYKHELLEHVGKFLFSSDAMKGVRYLQLSAEVQSRLLNCATVDLRTGTTMLLGKVPTDQAVAELFISDYGIGVLSLNVAADVAPSETDASPTPGLTPQDAAELNYQLSRLDARVSACTAHRGKHQVRTQPHQPLAAPQADAPVLVRASKLGGRFTFVELIQYLVEPLARFGFQASQEQLSVYTVARFGEEADFGVGTVHAALEPALLALAQIEEAGHAGAVPADSPICATKISRRHWAGISLLGAAHLVSAQPPSEYAVRPGRVEAPNGGGFNEERPRRAFWKYFGPYLAALLQNLALLRIMRDGREALGPQSPGRDGLHELRGRLLAFCVKGHFTRVSTRHAIHRYYRTCQNGLDVRSALEDARTAIADADAAAMVDRQMDLANKIRSHVEATREHAAATRRMQGHLTTIECLIVSVYAAHLAHMTLEHHMSPLALSVTVGIVALVSLSLVARFLKPWKHWRAHGVRPRS